MVSAKQNSLEDLHREAEARWPGVSLELDSFSRLVSAAPDATHASDLYLAAACLAKNPRAIEVFEREIIQAVRTSVRRACRKNGVSEEDVLQITKSKLLAGPPEPKLAQYTGKGPLLGWVRVVAVREALQAARKTRRERPSDDGLLIGAVTSTSSVEFGMLKDLHGKHFAEAVREAMRRLTPDQRAVLRFHLRDGLSIDQIAPMLGVHRATAARRLERAREDVLAHTQEVLRERHGLTQSEVKSLCVALGREVDISLERALDDEERS